MLQKNAWPRHYPKGSAVSKIGSYFLEALFRVFISNEWCRDNRNSVFDQTRDSSAVSKIGSYFLEELFRVFFISNGWCLVLFGQGRTLPKV